MYKKKLMINLVEYYFENIDSFNIPAVLSCLTKDAQIEIVTSSLTHIGRDEDIRTMLERRKKATEKAWHGNFKHLVDTENGWVTSRFDIKRKSSDGKYREMDNINFFTFDGLKIKKISIWMSGENSLP